MSVKTRGAGGLCLVSSIYLFIFFFCSPNTILLPSFTLTYFLFFFFSFFIIIFSLSRFLFNEMYKTCKNEIKNITIVNKYFFYLLTTVD